MHQIKSFFLFLKTKIGVFRQTEVSGNTAKTERNAHTQNNSALRCTI